MVLTRVMHDISYMFPTPYFVLSTTHADARGRTTNLSVLLSLRWDTTWTSRPPADNAHHYHDVDEIRQQGRRRRRVTKSFLCTILSMIQETALLLLLD